MMHGELGAKILSRLIRAGGFVRGSELAKELGVSRATVHRVIEELREMGYAIESHPRKGYRLVVGDELSMAPQYVMELLRDKVKVRPLLHFIDACRSTQDIAELFIKEAGVREGLIVLAERMTAGRGRMGREWYAPPGGLWFTVLLKPPRMRGFQLLSIAAGVAVAETIRELYGIDVKLKWPNDVVYKGRKVCGILVEGRFEADRPQYVLVGIGINVNNEVPEEVRDVAITLKEILGRNVPRLPLLTKVLMKLFNYYQLLREGRLEEVLEKWKRYSETLGKRVKVIGIMETVTGTAVDIDGDGSLVIETDDGERVRMYAGDVIYVDEDVGGEERSKRGSSGEPGTK